eukprot:961527-Amorphochlora_amoeboformis.AAC.2
MPRRVRPVLGLFGAACLSTWVSWRRMYYPLSSKSSLDFYNLPKPSPEETERSHICFENHENSRSLKSTHIFSQRVLNLMDI